MDPHPTPFPGKLRPPANSKKDKGEGKISKEPNRLATIPFRHRQDRVFGTVRSTNTTVGRPPQGQTKAFKQPKPSVISKKLPTKTGAKVGLKKKAAGASSDDVVDAARKPKSEPPRKTSVRFQYQWPEEKSSSEGVAVAEDGPRTPLSSIKPLVLLGTPFYTAKSCSKCRFDRLESAPYWLNQITLAESVGKHFVSAAFFRLALECNAQPIQSLKSEVKRYVARHSSLHVATVWRELCRDYGLLNEDLSVGVILLDPLASSVVEKEDSAPVVVKAVSGDRTDVCLESGLGGISQSGEPANSTKDADSTSVGENPSAAVSGDGTHEDMNKPAESFAEDNLMTVKNASASSTPVELNAKSGQDPSAGSTSANLDTNTGEKNQTAASTPVKLDSDTGEKNQSADSTPAEQNSHNTGENPNVDSTLVELNRNTGGDLIAALIGEGAKEVVNSSQDSLMMERTDGSSAVNECANEGSSVVVTPREIFLLEKSERTSSPPPGSSPVRKSAQPRKLADTSNRTVCTSQTSSGSCGERVDKSKYEPTKNQKSKDAAKKNQSGRVKSPRWV